MNEIFAWAHSSAYYLWSLLLTLFLISLFALSLVRRIVWNRLSKLTERTRAGWDEAALDSLVGPFRLLTLVGAVVIAGQFAPPEIRLHPAAVFGSKIALVLIAVWMLERFLSAIFRSDAFPNLTDTTRTLVQTVIRVSFIVIAVLVVLDTAGVSITPILASLGVGSVAVALALQDTLSNFFGGLYLLVDKPIRIGDYVQIEEGTEGFVTKIGWRSTHIRQLANNVIVVPNSKVAEAKLKNFDLPQCEQALLIQVGVSYNSDLSHVEAVTIDTALQIQKTLDGAISDFSPFIRYHTFNNSSIDFTVILRVKSYTDNFLVKHEFIKALHKRYREENIEIPFPQRVVTVVHNGSDEAVAGMEVPRQPKTIDNVTPGS